jgi:hypothetical protein
LQFGLLVFELISHGKHAMQVPQISERHALEIPPAKRAARIGERPENESV